MAIILILLRETNAAIITVIVHKNIIMLSLNWQMKARFTRYMPVAHADLHTHLFCTVVDTRQQCIHSKQYKFF